MAAPARGRVRLQPALLALALLVGEGAVLTTLKDTVRYEQVIGKSRFIAFAGRAASKEEALAFVQAHSDQKATHNCYAYQLSDGTIKSTNDGEPSGTAGKPIAAAIGGSGFTDVVVLVIRHYGGVKLGTGGLVRAYGGVAAEALRLGTAYEMTACVECFVEFAPEDTGHVFTVLGSYPNANPAGGLYEFTSAGTLQATFVVPLDDLPQLDDRVQKLTAGRVHLERKGLRSAGSRRRLAADGCAVPGGGVQVPSPWGVWSTQWQERVGAWWLHSPYQVGLEACMLAFGVELADALENEMRKYELLSDETMMRLEEPLRRAGRMSAADNAEVVTGQAAAVSASGGASAVTPGASDWQGLKELGVNARLTRRCAWVGQLAKAGLFDIPPFPVLPDRLPEHFPPQLDPELFGRRQLPILVVPLSSLLPNWSRLLEVLPELPWTAEDELAYPPPPSSTAGFWSGLPGGLGSPGGLQGGQSGGLQGGLQPGGWSRDWERAEALAVVDNALGSAVSSADVREEAPVQKAFVASASVGMGVAACVVVLLISRNLLFSRKRTRMSLAGPRGPH